MRKGATTARVRIAITGVTVITSTITNEAIHDLALAVGDDAYALIEALRGRANAEEAETLDAARRSPASNTAHRS